MNDFSNVLRFVEPNGLGKVLAINPRDGKLPLALRDDNPKMQIDSFVSDEEWVGSAQRFSENVIHGSSHHPLACIESEIYDLILVCEDMGYVDDCDAMICEYFRLLQQGGVLFGGIWNLSYVESISALLNSKKVGIKSDLCGYGSIPLDCLCSRLDELAFSEIKIHNLYGDADCAGHYAEISKKNIDAMPEERFKTRIHIISATK